jgi:hypothetical protein
MRLNPRGNIPSSKIASFIAGCSTAQLTVETAMNDQAFRIAAMALPEAEEKSHFGKADFRVRNRIFASLPDATSAVLKLTREQQDMLTGAEPALFAAIPGGWGKRGWTRLSLANCDEATLQSALWMAWRNAASAGLVKRQDQASIR